MGRWVYAVRTMGRKRESGVLFLEREEDVLLSPQKIYMCTVSSSSQGEVDEGGVTDLRIHARGTELEAYDGSIVWIDCVLALLHRIDKEGGDVGYCNATGF